MSRRIIPGLFWAGMVFITLLAGTRLWASGPPNRPTKVQGHWDGFFLEADASVLGLVQSDLIPGRHPQEVNGQGLLALDARSPFAAWNFGATVADDSIIAGTGTSTLGRLVIHGQLETFTTSQGDIGGFWEPDLHFIPTRTRPVQISSTLLHPFPVDDAPNIGDMTAFGRFEGLTDTSLQGSGVMMFNSLDDRGAYPGSFGFIPDDPNRHAAFSWPIRATTAANGQFLMIGQGRSGSMTYVGSVITQNGSPSELWGIARLSFLNGRVLYNAYNCSFTSLNQ